MRKTSTNKFKLTKFQRQVIVGTLLGNAYAETQDLGVSYRLKFSQSNIHKDYLFHLYDVFKECCGALPHQELNENWAFSTYSSVSLRFYGMYFYDKKRKKCIPKNIGKFLTPVVLAYWYMDDGSLKSRQFKGVILNTHCFSYKEIVLLVETLRKKYQLEAKPQKQEDGFQICISEYSYDTFMSLVSPYIHRAMLYKLPFPRKSRCMN